MYNRDYQITSISIALPMGWTLWLYRSKHLDLATSLT